MPSNMLRPEDWFPIIKRIQDGDQSVAGWLADRERHFDNFFDTFEYVPKLLQPPPGTEITPVSSAAAKIFRIGTMVFMTAQITASTTGVANNNIGVSLPKQLPPVNTGLGAASGGSFEVVDFSTTTLYEGRPIVVQGLGSNDNYVVGMRDGSTVGSIGRYPSIPVDNLDVITVAVFYHAQIDALL